MSLQQYKTIDDYKYHNNAKDMNDGNEQYVNGIDNNHLNEQPINNLNHQPGLIKQEAQDQTGGSFVQHSYLKSPIEKQIGDHNDYYNQAHRRGRPSGSNQRFNND